MTTDDEEFDDILKAGTVLSSRVRFGRAAAAASRQHYARGSRILLACSGDLGQAQAVYRLLDAAGFELRLTASRLAAAVAPRAAGGSSPSLPPAARETGR